MNDKEFKELDDAMMKNMAPLREQKVNERMLKGFSASVERKITSGVDVETRPAVRRWAPLWVPSLAVLMLASWVALRSPLTTMPSPAALSLSSPVELAQVTAGDDIQNEVALLKALGELSDEEEAAVLGDEQDSLNDADSELSYSRQLSSIA